MEFNFFFSEEITNFHFIGFTWKCLKYFYLLIYRTIFTCPILTKSRPTHLINCGVCFCAAFPAFLFVGSVGASKKYPYDNLLLYVIFFKLLGQTVLKPSLKLSFGSILRLYYASQLGKVIFCLLRFFCLFQQISKTKS